MFNIVSIDFDIMMAPSIELYNNIVGPNRWEEDFLKNPQLVLSQIDCIHYQVLTQWLINAFAQMNPENIHFIQDHEKIINYLPREDDAKIILTNIDHHHDISYVKEHAENIITKDNLTCGNWVKYISDNKQLKRYYWVHNGNSQQPSPDNPDIINSKIDLKDFNLKNLSIPDCLVICLSPMWVPPNYRQLFYTWIDICNFIHNTRFEIEG